MSTWGRHEQIRQGRQNIRHVPGTACQILSGGRSTLFSALRVSGFLCAPDSAGFARSVSAGPVPSHDIVAVPSTATISALPSGSARFNFAGEPAGDEHAGRTL